MRNGKRETKRKRVEEKERRIKDGEREREIDGGERETERVRWRHKERRKMKK